MRNGGGTTLAQRLGWTPFQRRRFERRLSLTVAGAFALLGCAWVLGTDLLLYRVISDAQLITRIETAKGWLFVGGAGVVVYLVALRAASRLTSAQGVACAVIESIGDGVLLLGEDRTIELANPAAERMLRTASEDLVGMGRDEFQRRFHVTRLDGSVVPPEHFVSQRVFDEGGPLSYQAVLHPPGEREVVITATAAAVREVVGAPPALVVSVMHDITDTERLGRMRDQFFAAAAHSLKNPVAVIKANAQALAEALGTPYGRQIHAIERQCDRIDRLVQNLQVVSRSRTGSLRIFPKPIALGAIAERAVREMAAAVTHRSLDVSLEADPRVRADEERVGLVVRNLIDAAARDSVPGAPVVLELREEAGQAQLGVRWRPLPPEERTSATYGEFDDLGISRYASRIIIELHGGVQRSETLDGEQRDWVELPTLGEREEDDDAR